MHRLISDYLGNDAAENDNDREQADMTGGASLALFSSAALPAAIVARLLARTFTGRCAPD